MLFLTKKSQNETMPYHRKMYRPPDPGPVPAADENTLNQGGGHILLLNEVVTL